MELVAYVIACLVFLPLFFRELIMTYKVVEKNNPLAVHAHCMTEESALKWINEKAPLYASRGYFMDKTLNKDSFTIKNDNPKRK